MFTVDLIVVLLNVKLLKLTYPIRFTRGKKRRETNQITIYVLTVDWNDGDVSHHSLPVSDLWKKPAMNDYIDVPRFDSKIVTFESILKLIVEKISLSCILICYQYTIVREDEEMRDLYTFPG